MESLSYYDRLTSICYGKWEVLGEMGESSWSMWILNMVTDLRKDLLQLSMRRNVGTLKKSETKCRVQTLRICKQRLSFSRSNAYFDFFAFGEYNQGAGEDNNLDPKGVSGCEMVSDAQLWRFLLICKGFTSEHLIWTWEGFFPEHVLAGAMGELPNTQGLSSNHLLASNFYD